MKLPLLLGAMLLIMIALNPKSLALENKKDDYFFVSRRECPKTVKHQIDCQFGEDSAHASELIENESGFNLYAKNPTSGACGLGQALPCSKMKCELSDAKCQVGWIKSYVDRRYGNVRNALAFWQSQSPHYY